MVLVWTSCSRSQMTMAVLSPAATAYSSYRSLASMEGTSVPTLRPSRCVISTQSRLVAPELRFFWLAQFS